LIGRSESDLIMSGFSFSLRTEYNQAPLSIQMVEQVLRWNGINPTEIASLVADQILRFVIDGLTERDFRRWCESGDSPEPLRYFPTKWGTLLFSSVSGAICACHQRKQLLEVSEGIFPYWQLFSMSRFCGKHSSLDGFIAPPSDPIWADIYPPNGWMCACTVIVLLQEDVPRRARISRPISEVIRAECRNWLLNRPDRIFKWL